jgi:hypothetical protein
MTMLSRPLDFIIFGVPRSGTKGLVRALNLHPHVYCARERFDFRTDHSSIRFPESFLDSSLIPNGRAKLEQVRQELVEKIDVRQAGNKLPRYYLAVGRINREVPALRNVWIYRSPFGFMPSWNRREADDGGGQWPKGQLGLFGLIELFVCIENCLDLGKDVFVFPYAHGLATQSDSILATLDFLGADAELYDPGRFASQQKFREANRRLPDATPQRAALQDHEDEILEVLRIRELDKLMDKKSGLRVSEIEKPLRDYLDSVTEEFAPAFDRAFSNAVTPVVDTFARQYFNRHRADLTGFLKRTSGSRAMADFRRLGFYQRLKLLYLQHSLWKRRFAPFRTRSSA